MRDAINSRSIQRRFPILGKFRAVLFQSLDIAVILSVVFLATARASTGDNVFQTAETAYKANKFDEAAAGYESILADGKFAPEIFFNLGNVKYRQGKIGEAVLNYRRAWMLAPRDADINANLGFALQRANAPGPDFSVLSRAVTKLTASEWLSAAVALYWIAAILFAAFIFRKQRKGFRKASIAFAAAACLSLAGAGKWWILHQKPEIVLLAKTQAISGPYDGAPPLLSLPEGSIVRQVERRGDWVNVESGRETGWIKSRACATVYPWQAADAVR